MRRLSFLENDRMKVQHPYQSPICFRFTINEMMIGLKRVNRDSHMPGPHCVSMYLIQRDRHRALVRVHVAGKDEVDTVLQQQRLHGGAHADRRKFALVRDIGRVPVQRVSEGETIAQSNTKMVRNFE